MRVFLNQHGISGSPPLPAERCPPKLSHIKCFEQPFCKSQFPRKSVNLFFMLVMMKDKLTDLCGNRLLQSDYVNTFCEISTLPSEGGVACCVLRQSLGRGCQKSILSSRQQFTKVNPANVGFEKTTHNFDLTQCVNQMVLESQLPHRAVNLLF